MSKITETRIGKICAKHPELQGKRLASTGNCIQCHRDAAAKRYAARTMTVGQEITTLRGQLYKLQMENEVLRKALRTIRDGSNDIVACEWAVDALIDAGKVND